MVILLLVAACGPVGLVDNSEEPGEGLVVIEPLGKVEFGGASPYGRSVSQTVVASSVGEAPVRVESAYTESDVDGVFYVGNDPFPLTLRPEEEVSFEVRFLPEDRGTVRGTLVLEGEEGPVAERTLIGTGCADGDEDGEC